MEPELLNLFGAGGQAAAVVITVILFLRHLRISHQRDTEERMAERKLLLGVIVNDLAHVGEALKEVNEGLTCVKKGLDEVVRKLEKE